MRDSGTSGLSRSGRAVLAAGAVALVGLLAPGLAAAAPAPPIVALSFDDGQGLRVVDSSPVGNNGTISGARWSEVGRNGGALQFDGDDFVEIADSPSLDVTNLTMEAWVKPDDVSGYGTVIGRPNSNYYLYASIGSPNPRVHAFSGDWGVNGRALEPGQWAHIAATYDEPSRTWTMYLNGEEVNEGFGTPPPPSDKALRIGNNAQWPLTEGFDGLIDDLRIYNRALSADEVARDMDARVRLGATTAPRPLMALSFDEGAGAIASDSSTFSNVGYLSGPTWTHDGRFGKALSFNGAGDLVTVADNGSLEVAAHTVEAWVKPRSLKPWTTIVMKEAPPLHTLWVLGSSGSAAGSPPHADIALGPTNATGGTGLDGTTALPINQWTHVAYTVGGGTLRMFINGVQVSSVASADAVVSTKPDQPLRIGGNSMWDDQFFDGVIDEVRIYDSALTGTQLQTDRLTPIGRSLQRPETTPAPGGGDSLVAQPALPAPQAEGAAPSTSGPVARPVAAKAKTTAKSKAKAKPRKKAVTRSCKAARKALATAKRNKAAKRRAVAKACAKRTTKR